MHTLEKRQFPFSTHFQKALRSGPDRTHVPVRQPYSTVRGYDLQRTRYGFCSCFLHRTLGDHLIRASPHLSVTHIGAYAYRSLKSFFVAHRILFTPSSGAVSPEPKILQHISHVRTGSWASSEVGQIGLHAHCHSLKLYAQDRHSSDACMGYERGFERDVYIMESSTFLSASFIVSDSDHSTSAISGIRFRC